MISLPPGFDASVLVADFFSVSGPIVGIVAVIACAVIIHVALRDRG